MYQKELLKEANLYIDSVNTDFIPGIIEEYEDEEDDDIPPTIFIPLEKFIELQVDSIIKENKQLTYYLDYQDFF